MRIRRSAVWTAFVGLLPVCALAQKGSASLPSPARWPSGENGSLIPPSSPAPSPNRPVFIDGRVVFDDGSPSNPNIRIERVCGATVRLQGHTDTKGQFYFQLGENLTVDSDASAAGSSLSTAGMPSLAPAANPRTQVRSGGGCEIRAVYPGFRSDVFNIPLQQNLDDLHIGTLILHRLGAVKGTTISATTALAPKNAQKAFDKGMQLAGKGRFDEAEEHFQKATSIYPQYASAWFALGEIEQNAGKLDDAQKYFKAAIAADKNYVSPYNQLAQIAGQQKQWQDAARYSRQVLQLNPVEFPSAYWYNAVANYNLQQWKPAQDSILQLIKMDAAHQFRESENLAGHILLQLGDFDGAAQHMRAYLALNPSAKDADSVKDILARLARNDNTE